MNHTHKHRIIAFVILLIAPLFVQLIHLQLHHGHEHDHDKSSKFWENSTYFPGVIVDDDAEHCPICDYEFPVFSKNNEVSLPNEHVQPAILQINNYESSLFYRSYFTRADRAPPFGI